MYKDISTNDDYPKTLIIRNHLGGMVWQVYHIEEKEEADQIAKNATKNGFEAITLENYNSELEQTWPNWRETGNIKLKAK